MTVVIRTFMLVLLLASVRPILKAQGGPGLSGHWEGTIHMPSQDVGVTVDLAPGRSGGWIGTMTIPMAKAVDVPLAAITVTEAGMRVRFTAEMPGRPSFDGALAPNGSSVTGDASNAEGAVQFELKRAGEAHVNVPPASSPLSKTFEGRWSGTVNSGGTAMRIVLTLERAADGSARATLTNLDQGNQEIPVAAVALTATEVRLDARAVSGTYHGTLNGTGEIVGELTQGASRLPLTFKRAQ